MPGSTPQRKAGSPPSDDGPQVYSVLGPLQVRRGDTSLSLGGQKQRTVLAVLLANSGHIASVDTLTDAVWDSEPAEKAEATLQVYVSALRRILGPGRAGATSPIVTHPPGYRLDVEVDQVDLQVYRRLDESGRAAAQKADHRRAAQLFRQALGLWSGRALADLEGNRFADQFAVALDEERMATTERRIDADLAIGRHAEVVGELTTLTAEHPLRERLQGQLMVALYRSGRQADALASYHRLRTSLDDELGVLPGPEIRELYDAILNHSEVVTSPKPTPMADLGRTATIQAAGRFRAALAVGDQLIPLDGICTIGRGPSCTVTLDDAEASREHAEIRTVVGGYLLIDLGSTNGTTIDGVPVRERFLTGGELIRIGNTPLRLEPLD